MQTHVQDHDKAYLVLIFRRARSNFQKIIRTLTGNEVHVDVGVFLPKRTPPEGNFLLYSAYINRTLQKTDAHCNYYESGEDTAYVLETNTVSAMRVDAFLNNLHTKQCKYNYADLIFCVMPHSIIDVIPDVDTLHIQKVFCSQLAILSIRVMTQNDPSAANLAQTAANLNSRTVSPAALRVHLAPFLRKVDLLKYLTGAIVFADSSSDLTTDSSVAERFRTDVHNT